MYAGERLYAPQWTGCKWDVMAKNKYQQAIRLLLVVLDAKLMFALSLNAVRGLGCVLHAFLIMLLMEQRLIQVDIELIQCTFFFFFFGKWHYTQYSIN